MINRYRVWIRQEVKFPVEVIGHSQEEAIDTIATVPNQLTPDHVLGKTMDDHTWDIEVVDADINETTQWSIDVQRRLIDQSGMLYQQAHDQIKEFSQLTYDQRGSFSWCTGVYESLLSQLIAGQITGPEALANLQQLKTEKLTVNTN